MSKYMILEAEPLSQADIQIAIKRAHKLRSEATWNVFVKLSDKLSKLFHFGTSDSNSGSGLAHSS